MLKYQYAEEKFNQACYALGTGSGDVISRLRCAFNGALLMIRAEDHLPPHLQNEWNWVASQISLGDRQSKRDETKKPKIFDTQTDLSRDLLLSKLDNSTGAAIARKIFYIARELESLH